MKFYGIVKFISRVFVTPFAGVWIEIIRDFPMEYPRPSVTPFAGVWIEITPKLYSVLSEAVTPFAGVWIEIDTWEEFEKLFESHSLRGSVD